MGGSIVTPDAPRLGEVMRSTRYALVVAGGYALLAVLWIVLSGTVARRLSANVEQLERLELTKGILYVVVTALAVFFGARMALARLEHADDKLRRRDAALLANERQVFAGQMAASIAHDANNVLQAVIVDLDSLRRAIGGDEKLKRLGESVDRLIALNRRLLGTVQQGRAGTAEWVDLSRTVRDALALAAFHEHMRKCDVRFQAADEFPMRTHPLVIHQIVSPLVVNACEATGKEGHVEVRLEREANEAVLSVHDDGPGVPTERRARLFDALESTKRDGTGLGLFSVQSCVRALGGTVEVGDSPLGGACFRVRLPIPPAA
jgi:signal transduction histidine kinase